MRFRKSVKNLLVSWVGQAAYIIINLFIRKVFINALGADILGIGGLFSNILSVLSFAELGISSAICYSLYRPLAEQDIEKIRQIMYFFKVVYRWIGIFILVAGTGFMFGLSLLVPEVDNYKNIYIYYELFVINTAISYFYVYNATLIEANQDRYIKIVNHYLWVCLLGILQIIFLIYFQNYIIYLILQIVFTLVENICISKIADRKFPYLKEKKCSLPEKKILKEIRKNVAGTSVNKLRALLVLATDNILISRFAGLTVTGFYSNYTYIVNGVSQILIQIYGAVQAGIGDLNVREDIGRVREIYKEILFYGYTFYSFGFIVLMNCISDFICVWIGKEATLNSVVVYLNLWCFYLTGMRETNIIFLNALGLQWRGKYRVVLEGVINLGISVVFGMRIGLPGIIVGTLISGIVVGGILEPEILCKYGLKTNILFWIVPFMKYSICSVVASYFIWIVNSKILMENIAGMLFVKAAVSFILYFTIVYVVWGRTEEFKRLKNRLYLLLKHKAD